MKPTLWLAAFLLASFGLVIEGQAHPGGAGGMGMGHPAGVGITIPSGMTVGPQNLPTGGSLVNNGSIVGGIHTGVTAGGPNPVTIINNGSITSTTGGIKTSGGPSSTIVNTGTITVGQTVTSTTGHATATGGTGISQVVGP
jgi:hypothetical protein